MAQGSTPALSSFPALGSEHSSCFGPSSVIVDVGAETAVGGRRAVALTAMPATASAGAVMLT